MSGPGDGSVETPAGRGFTVERQKLELEVDFVKRSLKGKTAIYIVPLSKELKTIRLNCRQCVIKRLAIEERAVNGLKHNDPYPHLKPRANSTVHQHHLLRSKFEPPRGTLSEEELTFNLPKSLPIRETEQFVHSTQNIRGEQLQKDASDGAEGVDIPVSAIPGDQTAQFATLRLDIEFEIPQVRDGLQFVGLEEGDTRYPHVYTSNSPLPGNACCLFPCLDDLQSRCAWEISIRCPRTLGHAFRIQSHQSSSKQKPQAQKIGNKAIGLHKEDGSLNEQLPPSLNYLGLSDEESSIEMNVICSGELTDEILDPFDESSKTVSFLCSSPASANQIGFAIGPMEAIDLSDLREIDEDDKLGSEAKRIHAYALPGRASEVRNTCMALAKAIDFFTTTFTSFPFESYKLCFLDDMISDTIETAGLSFCSNRLVFPEDIIEPLIETTRKLVFTLAAQYAGISLVPKEPADSWIILGMASFMTDLFLKKLCGNNEYRYQQKCMADRVYELDVNRPSLFVLGTILYLGPFEREFVTLKAGLVFFILDRRLTKSSGSTGLGRIVGRILRESRGADVDSTFISTSQFHRRCEKMGHIKLDSFFQQWIMGAGCPRFVVSQRFNRKKLVVEMIIKQMQGEQLSPDADLQPENFLRDVREEMNEVDAGAVQPVFTGPMTIRIHEADGTPYEHIIDIKEATTKVEIPYNTKYKRLKRSKKQKERTNAAAGVDAAADAQDDVLLYCLGDVLQSEEEVAEWRLADWPAVEEEKMGSESYEWIRMDADFEWICKMNIQMPGYMFLSQLQQDRDIVAQMESLQYMTTQQATPLMSTILIRTLMDTRYFHGIRTLAASELSRCAREELSWIGLFHLEKAFQHFFCIDDTPMTKPNDFTDRIGSIMQCAIPKAIAKIRDTSGKPPKRVRQFILEKIKFNDNSKNNFSDCHYVATLMSCLTETLTGTPNRFHDVDDEFLEDEEEAAFQRDAIVEIDRYRRIDEWISSYRNVYSTTALDCMLQLFKARVIKTRFADFLRYFQPGNADEVRIKALTCLIELDMLQNCAVLNYCLRAFSTDPSPYMRDQIFRLLCKGLGLVALADKTNIAPKAVPDGGLIVEETAIEDKQAELARRKTVSGALAALKEQYAEDESLKEALWLAVSSPIISMTELGDLLSLCGLLYVRKTSLVVTLHYPRYWSVQHVGRGKLVFKRSNKIRTKPLPVKEPPPTEPLAVSEALTNGAAAPTPTTPASGSLTIKFPKSTGPKLQRKPSVAEANGNTIKLFTEPVANSPTKTEPFIASPIPSQPTPSGQGLILKLKTNGFIPKDRAPGRKCSEAGSSRPNGLGNISLKSPDLQSASALMSPPSNSMNGGGLSHSPPPRPPSAASSSSSKKRKSSVSQPLTEAASGAPVAKKPMLKLRLSSFGAGSASSPPPPPGSR